MATTVTKVRESELSALAASAYGLSDYIRVVSSTGNSRKTLISEFVKQVMSAVSLADTYTAQTYAVGDYCVRDGVLYRCTTAITSAETFNANHWTAVTLGDELTRLDRKQKLLCDEVPNTVQSYTFTDGSVSQVAHKINNVAVRTDTFTYGTNTITETRTLATGEVLTIVTNLTTLETSVSYVE